MKGSYCIPNEGVPNPKFAPKYDDICEKINLDANSDARFNYKYVRSFILWLIVVSDLQFWHCFDRACQNVVRV